MIRALYSEPNDPADKAGKFILARGFHHDVAGMPVLIVDGILTSGGTIRRTVEAVELAGGNVMGVSVVGIRQSITADDLGVPELRFLADLREFEREVWTEQDCPLCQAHRPAVRTDYGRGRAWLAKRLADSKA